MNEIPRQRLPGLLAVHGPGLLGHPEIVEQSLREQCPDCDKEIYLITLVLERTTSSELRCEFDSADLARRLSQSTRVPEDELRWAAEGWFAAIHGAETAPPAPRIAMEPGDAEGNSSDRREMAIMGARSGLSTGLIVSLFLSIVAFAQIHTHGSLDATGLALIGWIVASPLVAGAVGWLVGPVLGATQKELAGGVAGAVLGAMGGVSCSGMIRPLLTPLSDPTLDAIRRITLCLTTGLLVGASIGLLHGVIWKRLRRRRRYNYWTGHYYPISAVEQELQEEIDRRAGIR